MEIHKRAIVLLASLLIQACGGIPKPKDFSDAPEPLLKVLEDQRRALTSLSAELQLDVWKDDKRVKLKQLMAVDHLGRVRLEILSSFGNPVTTLTSDGSRLMIYDSDQKRFFLGASTAENISRLIPIHLSPEELSALLRGTIPEWTDSQSRVYWDSTRGRYVLHQTSGSREQRVEMEPGTSQVRRLERRTDGRLDFRIKLGDYRSVSQIQVPHRLLFESPERSVSVDMTIIDVTVNPEIPDSTFTLEAPRGIVVESL